MLINIECEICGTECEVKFCCDGNNGCGCGGIVDPPVCSTECFNKLMNKNKDEDENE